MFEIQGRKILKFRKKKKRKENSPYTPAEGVELFMSKGQLMMPEKKEAHQTQLKSKSNILLIKMSL